MTANDGPASPADPTAPAPAHAGPAAHPRRRRGIAIAAAAIVVIAGALIAWRLLGGGEAETDDAFTDAHVAQLAFSVGGRVVAVRVEENQHVEAGTVIAEIDPDTYRAALARAEAELAGARARAEGAAAAVELARATTDAALRQAEAELAAQRARLDSARAEAAAAAAAAERAESDRRRYETLAAGSATQQAREQVRMTATATAAQAEAAKTAVAAAEAAVGAAEARVGAARAGVHQVAVAETEATAARAAVDAAEASVDARRTDLASTRLVAPFAGTIARRMIEPGGYAQVGAPQLALVGDDGWVTANFKETDLARIRPGQAARLRIDATGEELAGRVDSIQAGSGAAFSLLPAENATGNFIKVVQRVPVKLVFAQPPARRLGPGLSVVARVAVR